MKMNNKGELFYSMLIFTTDIKKLLYEEAKSQYPLECCGILLGRREKNCRIVTEIYKTENAQEPSMQKEHFLIPTTDLLFVEYLAEKKEKEIVGFYHSHADYGADASEEDESYAIPGNSYPIISVIDGKIVEISSWEKCYENGMEYFVKEKIEIENE
jgi:proteasome lid subunit RPN8/RPN11